MDLNKRNRLTFLYEKLKKIKEIEPSRQTKNRVKDAINQTAEEILLLETELAKEKMDN